MSKYQVADVRNLVLAGHGASGKTSLADALLWFSKAVDRKGNVADHTSFSDTDDEEHKRGISIDSACLHLTHEGKQVRLIDTPGYPDLRRSRPGRAQRRRDRCHLRLGRQRHRRQHAPHVLRGRQTRAGPRARHHQARRRQHPLPRAGRRPPVHLRHPLRPLQRPHQSRAGLQRPGQRGESARQGSRWLPRGHRSRAWPARRGRRRGRRVAHGEVPQRRHHLRCRAGRRAPPRHRGRHRHPDLLRQREEGPRPERPARRHRPVHALAADRSEAAGHERPGRQGREGRTPARPGRATRRPGLQDRPRQVRRHPELHPRLPGHVPPRAAPGDRAHRQVIPRRRPATDAGQQAHRHPGRDPG